MKFEIVHPREVQIKENGVKRLAQVGQKITVKELPDRWDGEISWRCDRTGNVSNFVEVGGEFYEDIKQKVSSGRLPKKMFYEEQGFFSGRDRVYYEEDIIDWSATIRRKAAGLRLQGERIWKRSPGPVLKIASKQYGWHTSLVSGQPELRNDHLFTFHFGLDELESARDWLKSMIAEGRTGTFGELQINGGSVPFIDGAHLDAINVANTVRAEFSSASKLRNVPGPALGDFDSLNFWLGMRGRYSADWPPRYVPLDVTEIEDDTILRLLTHSAKIVGLLRKAGKKNFPQQSKNFNRHIERAEQWIAGKWPWRDGELRKLVNLTQNKDHHDDDGDDPQENPTVYY
ncbi:hypothetical protein [Rhizobium sp. BK176]|uniref:hypothetical protein n=1 Tax=Rhizobium sp. BK176 TaxID=2587071 RepID=UPI00216771F5|nr:hypothetical protein [Rhizobium sp. BK176]MCS4089177.1 hypothetical protein [Rhizobium sp. BK176]